MLGPAPIPTYLEGTDQGKAHGLHGGGAAGGETTLGEMIAQTFPNQVYLSWESPVDRARLIREPSFFETVERRDESTPFVMFDELNKHRGWRKYLKGVYDRFQDDYQFLIAGSSRLDYPQRRGDSLAGRYYLLHLWPFTQAELGCANLTAEEFFGNPQQVRMERQAELQEVWQTLSEHSGFPEPYLSGRKTSYRRWSTAYAEQLIREDIRDLTGIKAIDELETLYRSRCRPRWGNLSVSSGLGPGASNGLQHDPQLALHAAAFFCSGQPSSWTRGSRA